MTITLNKFGTALTSRMAGREALGAFRPSLDGMAPGENITVDFDGVITFSPSWGDEFLTPLMEMYGDRLTLNRTDNLSVKATLEMLEQIHERRFKIA